ncbi:PDR/VanB family oxidoreductase [Neobacillus niacini]|uniref:PDR/VanB family oxidoreductase n=1 Tax=Neobacillus niacini TaxID=86668 RepID=UPI00398321C1
MWQDANRIEVIVISVNQETPLVKKFTLAREDGEALPGFSSGSHITTYINGLERNYSLTNYQDQGNCYEIAIRLNDCSAGGSSYWHQHVKAGYKLKISYPKNHFPLSFKAKHHVFYAAGIGITPFLSMMAELKDALGSFELHFAAKSKEMCAFYGLIKEKYRDQSHFYFSEEIDSERLGVSSLLEHRIGTHVYFCGPELFISDFTDAAMQYGYPRSSIHHERFTPPLPKEKKPFLAELTNGKSVHVSMEKTLLEALLEEGIKIPYSCKVGCCGTCELKVEEGEIAHFDSFLSEEQKNKHNVILACVSRAKSEKLVLVL